MALPHEEYEWVEVETYIAERTSGLHGRIHVRPVAGGKFDPSLQVECSKEMIRKYPIGTRFRIWAKLTDREGGRPFLYTSYRWSYDVLARA